MRVLSLPPVAVKPYLSVTMHPSWAFISLMGQESTSTAVSSSQMGSSTAFIGALLGGTHYYVASLGSGRTTVLNKSNGGILTYVFSPVPTSTVLDITKGHNVYVTIDGVEYLFPVHQGQGGVNFPAQLIGFNMGSTNFNSRCILHSALNRVADRDKGIRYTTLKVEVEPFGYPDMSHVNSFKNGDRIYVSYRDIALDGSVDGGPSNLALDADTLRYLDTYKVI